METVISCYMGCILISKLQDLRAALKHLRLCFKRLHSQSADADLRAFFLWGRYSSPKGPRTQIIGFLDPEGQIACLQL